MDPHVHQPEAMNGECQLVIRYQRSEEATPGETAQSVEALLGDRSNPRIAERPIRVEPVDLDGAAPDDLSISYVDSCGNWGECEVALLAGCANGRFALLWGPEYAFSLEVQPQRVEGYATFLTTTVDRSPGHERTVSTRWARGHGRYRDAATIVTSMPSQTSE